LIRDIDDIIHVESYFTLRRVRKSISAVDQAIHILPHLTYTLLNFLKKERETESACVIRALGSDLPLVVVVFVALCSSLLTTLPITPAGLGAVEVSIIGILGLYGVSRDFAAAIALLDRIISYWNIIPLG